MAKYARYRKHEHQSSFLPKPKAEHGITGFRPDSMYKRQGRGQAAADTSKIKMKGKYYVSVF